MVVCECIRVPLRVGMCVHVFHYGLDIHYTSLYYGVEFDFFFCPNILDVFFFFNFRS